MPRNLRIKSITGTYHVMIRGVNKRNIFIDDEDREKILQLISYYKNKYDIKIYAYCLMDNHVHLLLKDKVNIDRYMQCIQTVYALYFNKKYKRIGHLFQDRFKSIPIENKKYLLECVRYIHQNPVKANIATINKYKWSSYNEYIKKEKIVETKIVLELFGKNKKNAIDSYITYMNIINYKSELKNIIIEDKLDDIEAINFIEKLYCVKMSEIKNYNRIDRNEILGKIKALNILSSRQISRITEIDRNIIRRL